MASVSDKDNGYRRLMRRATAGKSPTVKVGVFGELASAVHEGKSVITIGELAEMFEFGTGGQEERSWLRAYVDENNARIVKMIARLGEQVIKGTITEAQAMDLLGLKIVGEIQQRISAGIAPPNADSTIRRKGSSVPLIDHGQFRGSITHQVVGP